MGTDNRQTDTVTSTPVEASLRDGLISFSEHPTCTTWNCNVCINWTLKLCKFSDGDADSDGTKCLGKEHNFWVMFLYYMDNILNYTMKFYDKPQLNIWIIAI